MKFHQNEDDEMSILLGNTFESLGIESAHAFGFFL